MGEGLREQVYDSLLHVAQGFLDFRRNELEADQGTLRLIYDNALILLYRLLFILYAEARGLLPVDESEEYRGDYSLESIKRAVARHSRTGRKLLANTCTVWPRLTR